ncbi:MAG: hypothetical protein ACRENP_21520 [Longimicrobiales bacterium]
MSPRRSRSLLLWGSKSAGKTGVLGALYDLGQSTSPDGVWSLAPGDADPATTEYLIHARNALLERTSRPTHPRPDYPELVLTVRKRAAGTTVATLPLTFVDPAGELADEAARLLMTGAALIDRMISASGVIWLFDASVEKVDLETILRELSILTGRTEGRVKTPIALCLSKIDLLGAERMNHALADPRAALAAHLGEDAFDLFRRVFAQREHFAISSAGTEAGRIQPVGLNAVFDWLYTSDRQRVRAGIARQVRGRLAKFAVAVLLLLAGFFGVRAGIGKLAAAGAERNEQRLVRLEQAGRLYHQGQRDTVVQLLRADRLSDDHARVIEWDTLLAFAARDAGLHARAAGQNAGALMQLALERSVRALAHPRLAEDATPRIRLARAQACALLQCGDSTLRADLEYVIDRARDADTRRKARALLRDLGS